jgi:hypothetical protein
VFWKKLAPAACCDVGTSSSERIGFGGYWTVRMKSVKSCISLAGSSLARPSRPTKAGLNALKASCASSGLPPVEPPVRSPRQCIGPAVIMPRRLCVVIGPFNGWKGRPEPMRNGLGFGAVAVALASPRSQARLSKSPKMWQLAQAESPCAEVLRAS